MAYLLGYSCNFTNCSTMIPGEGKSEIKWTPVHQLVNMFLNPNLFHMEIKSLSGFSAENANKLLDGFLLVCMAGTAAEIVYDEDNSRTPVESINGKDADMIGDFINGIAMYGHQMEEDLIQKDFAVAHAFLKQNPQRNAVKILTERILSSPGYKLEKNQIESILSEINFVPLCDRD
jgi:hypothetical protein